jgi:hypothetical protein
MQGIANTQFMMYDIAGKETDDVPSSAGRRM